jgi:hypothetical protein
MCSMRLIGSMEPRLGRATHLYQRARRAQGLGRSI